MIKYALKHNYSFGFLNYLGINVLLIPFLINSKKLVRILHDFLNGLNVIYVIFLLYYFLN